MTGTGIPSPLEVDRRQLKQLDTLMAGPGDAQLGEKSAAWKANGTRRANGNAWGTTQRPGYPLETLVMPLGKPMAAHLCRPFSAERMPLPKVKAYNDDILYQIASPSYLGKDGKECFYQYTCVDCSRVNRESVFFCNYRTQGGDRAFHEHQDDFVRKRLHTVADAFRGWTVLQSKAKASATDALKIGEKTVFCLRPSSRSPSPNAIKGVAKIMLKLRDGTSLIWVECGVEGEDQCYHNGLRAVGGHHQHKHDGKKKECRLMVNSPTVRCFKDMPADYQAVLLEESWVTVSPSIYIPNIGYIYIWTVTYWESSTRKRRRLEGRSELRGRYRRVSFTGDASWQSCILTSDEGNDLWEVMKVWGTSPTDGMNNVQMAAHLGQRFARGYAAKMASNEVKAHNERVLRTLASPTYLGRDAKECFNAYHLRGLQSCQPKAHVSVQLPGTRRRPDSPRPQVLFRDALEAWAVLQREDKVSGAQELGIVEVAVPSGRSVYFRGDESVSQETLENLAFYQSLAAAARKNQRPSPNVLKGVVAILPKLGDNELAWVECGVDGDNRCDYQGLRAVGGRHQHHHNGKKRDCREMIGRSGVLSFEDLPAEYKTAILEESWVMGSQVQKTFGDWWGVVACARQMSDDASVPVLTPPTTPQKPSVKYGEA
ncbi:hypothetical protein BC832DRAFT_541648 [Gaertneriomyces semiglobifer]|nr:hypothetical protein BC832DRAFT_541648 [Gaertneriomyces semiglobifer]